MKASIYLIALLGVISKAYGACTTAYVPITDAEFKEIVPGELVVTRCNDGKIFSTDDVALAVKCVEDVWQSFQAICVAETPPFQPCATNPPEEPNAEIDPEFETDDRYRVYNCKKDMYWLSGTSKQVSQCRGGDWTPILDVCDAACEVPRECSAVAALGFNTSGWYYVIPSGNINDPAHMVFCQIDVNEPESERNWTLVLYNTATPISKSVTDYIGGFGNFSLNEQYFIGLNTLAAWGDEENHIPMMMETILTVNSENFTATYSDVVIGPEPTYQLKKVGDYHGNAGDAFCPHVYADFLPAAIDPTTQGAFWFGNPSGETTGGNADNQAFVNMITSQKGNHLTNALTWKPLESIGTASMGIVRFRPVSADVGCPPIIGTEPYWVNTKVDFINGSNTDRSVGQGIHYKCEGDLMMEGLYGGNRTTEGFIECDEDLTWSGNVNLPCTINCPEGYNLSADGTKCFRYSAEPAKDLVDAAQKCLKEQASLGIVIDFEDLKPADMGVPYLTGHVGRGQSSGFLQPVNTTVPGFDVAAATFTSETADCVTLTSINGTYGSLAAVDCEAPEQKYICQRPGRCPDQFVHNQGGCYRMDAASEKTIMAAYKMCAEQGAGLYYPVDVVQGGNVFMKLIEDSPSAVFGMGLNDALELGNWTHNSVYTVDANVTERINTTVPGRWVVATMSGDTMELATVASPLEEVPELDSAYCQLHAPIACAPALAVGGPSLPTANMSSDWDNETTALETEITYTCYEGYFVAAVVPNKTQEFICLGQLGGWYSLEYEYLRDCIAMPVCEGLTGNITLEPSLVENTTFDDSFFLNGTVTYTCPSNMGRMDDSDVYIGQDQNITCSEIEEGVYDFEPKHLFDCNVCLEEPVFKNATVEFEEEKHKVDDSLEVTCIENHEFVYYQDGTSVTTQTTTCTPFGWNKTELLIIGCHPACLTQPPEVTEDKNMYRDNFTYRGVDTQINYTCYEGYNIRPTEAYQNYTVTTTYVMCNASHVWEVERVDEELECVRVCQEPPPEPPEFSTRFWDGYSRTEDDTVLYTCDSSYISPNYSINMTFTCNGTHWIGPSEEYFQCHKCCMDPVEATHGGGIGDWKTGDDYIPAFVNEIANYSCPDTQATNVGTFNTSIYCMSDGNWSVADADFRCYNACDGGPPMPSPLAIYNYSETEPDFTEGVMVRYTCYGYFSTGNYTLDSYCVDGNWTLWDIPECYKLTTPGPFDPIYLPVGPEFEVSYGETTDFHAGSIDEVMQDINDQAGNFQATKGPFGFGGAVQLLEAEKQCMKKSNISKEPCLYNPKYCSDGLSMSLWEKTAFTGDVYTTYKDQSHSLRRYILSSGGDDEGHPGIAVYHVGLRLVVIVSTGEEAWVANSFNAMQNNTWTNVAFRWQYPYQGDDSKFYGGLQVFIMSEIIASVTMPNVKGKAALKPLEPQTIMIGCHKTSSNGTYWGFNDNEYDELATWYKAVPDNETAYFTAGYDESMANTSPSQFKEMIHRVPLTDKQQFGAVTDYLMRSTLPDAVPEEEEEEVEEVEDSPTSSTPTKSTGPSPSPEPDNNLPKASRKQMAKLENIYDILSPMLKESNLPVEMDMAEMCGRIKLTKVVSNIAGEETVNNWRAIQRNPDKAGLAGVVNKLEDWLVNGLQKISFNDSNPMKCNKVNKNIIVQTNKLRITDYLEKGKLGIAPNYRDSTITKEIREIWNLPTDRIEYPINIFPSLDYRCYSRPVTVKSVVYKTYDSIIPVRVHRGHLDESLPYSVDSRIMSLDVNVDPPMEDEFEGDDPCQPDLSVLKSNPVRFKFEHKSQVRARTRKLSFHHNEPTSNIMKRTCAWWNPDLSDFGAWDIRGCKIVETTEIHTKCNCDHFGMFTVLAELVPPREVPTELVWLKMVRYIGYIASAAGLIFYIVFVLKTPHLREQFHLIGVHLSISIVCGSLFMVISDFEGIRDSRHVCAAIGTLIHFFYTAAANWVTIFGHAAFRAITAGVVAGYLKAYSFICWGMATILVGIPYVYDIHMLGTDPRCLVSWDNMTKGIFLIPQCFLCFFAMIFGLIVLCNLATPALRKDNLIDDYGSFCQGTAFVMIYFAITWFLGTAANIQTDEITTDFYPIFQVFNAYTGVVMFIFIGLLSNRFYVALTGQVHKHKQHLKEHPFGKREARIIEESDDEVSQPLSPLATSRPPIRPDSAPAKIKSAGSSRVAGRSARLRPGSS